MSSREGTDPDRAARTPIKVDAEQYEEAQRDDRWRSFLAEAEQYARQSVCAEWKARAEQAEKELERADRLIATYEALGRLWTTSRGTQNTRQEEA